jgi:outer membrane protein assembly factor BamB
VASIIEWVFLRPQAETMKSRRPPFRPGVALAAIGILAITVAFAALVNRPFTTAASPTQAPSVKRAAWPMFGGTPARNMVNSADKNIPTDWSLQPKQEKHVLWSANLGSVAYGAPVVAEGKVFVGTNNENPRDPKIKGDRGVLMAFRASDGKFVWQIVHDKLPSGRVNDWPKIGVVSSPAVDGKRLYYVSNRCEVVCAKTEDGEIVWRLDMMKDLNVFPHNISACSPLVVDDLVFVVTSNGVDEGHIKIPEPKAPSFLAINKHSGKVVWSDNSPGDKIMHSQWSNPALAIVRGKPQVIFPGGDGWLRAFEPDSGKFLWKFDCNPKGARFILGGRATKNDFLATPVVWEDKLYIGVGQDPEHDEGIGHFWCVDLVKATRFGPQIKDGDVSPVNDNFDPRAAVNIRSALGWHYGGQAAADADRNYRFGRTLSTAAVHDGLVYACELAGYFHCLDAHTGEKYWEHNMEAASWSSPYWVDGKIYQGNDAGQIFIFDHGKVKKEPLIIETGAKYQRTSFVAADGVLYLVTETPTRLYAIGNK